MAHSGPAEPPGGTGAPDRRLVRLAEIGVEQIKGVGPKSQASLASLGIESVLDLITYYPRRHIDRTRRRLIAALEDGELATVLATVSRVESRRVRGGRSMVSVVLEDPSGRLRCTFFNQPWRARQLPEGTEVVVSGKVGDYRGSATMANPSLDVVGKPGQRRTGRVVPVYPQSAKAGISTWDIENWTAEALRRALSASGEFSDPVPPQWIAELDLVDRTTALRHIHFPDSLDDAARARRRIIFDEFLRLQLVLVERKVAMERDVTGIAHARHDLPGGLLEEFLSSLPFALTSAQQRAVAEIAADMARPSPMHRLLQGDVGSGKTLVAIAALLVAAQGGHQGAMMVPTEVLAEQHFGSMRSMLMRLSVDDDATLSGQRPFRVELLTSTIGAQRRARIEKDLACGTVDAVVGTQALLSEQLTFSSLGVVVVDEQHRFGVEQRAALRGRRPDGRQPDLLVMTATPIPRTVAMTIFGDLDTTVIGEMPPGRRPPRTQWLPGDEAAAWETVRAEVEAGHQAYVVCPLVGESEAVAARSATEEFFSLGDGPLKDLDLGLVHGQLTPREKERAMESFRSGTTQVLVSTTVIEVGVDVPNATVMVVMDAWRFGIAQLHQLRGRVGRGGTDAWCFLLGSPPRDEGGERSPAEMRLEALCGTDDGFALAEADLDIRGEGSVTGAAQSGRSALKLGSVRRDRELVEAARRAAEDMVDRGWSRRDDVDLGAEITALVDDEEAGFLFKG